MNFDVIRAILAKDFKEFTRDRFFAFITVLSLVAFIVMFWLLPSTVNETVKLGVSQTGLDDVIAAVDSPGLALVSFDSSEQLRTAVEQGTDGVVAGMAFPPEFVSQRGGTRTVELLVPADMPPEILPLMEGLADTISAAITGSVPPATVTTEVLGVDRVGDQTSLQEQMRPLLAFLVLLVETFALASLVAVEVHQRTVVAVLVTPATTRDFIAAKGIFGTGLAFTEASILLLAVGGFTGDPPILIVALLLGAVLVTGFGLIAGSFGKEFIDVLFISLVLMIPLMIPAFGALFPGSAAPWVRALPTYGLVQSIVGVTTRGETWADVGPALGALAAWGVVSFGVGTAILRRRVAML